MSIYGKDFAAAYNDKWGFWGEKMWPFLAQLVARRHPEARNWLDLCCGTGSLLKFVCEQGFSAVGLDISPHQLKYARKNAPGVELVQADMCTFSLPERFDVVTCMFDSLNYLTTKKNLERVFRRARRHLNADGLFAFDMNTFVGLREGWCRTSAMREPHRITIVETSFDEKRGLGCCLITGFVKEGRLWRRFEEEHIQRGYTAQEIEELLDRAGFVFTKYDGDTFSRPRKKSGRLLYICDKK